MIRVLFFGTESVARAQLAALLVDARFSIIEVVTQPPRPVGRKQIITKSPVHILAEENSLSVYTPVGLKSEEVFEHFAALKPDLIIVAQYGSIIPLRILQLAPFGALNVHGSLLPKYRGASPVHAAIIAGEKTTGVSFMMMDEKMDHGPIVSLYNCDITGDETTETLMEKIARLAAAHIADTAAAIVAGTTIATAQNHDEATFTTLLSRESGVIHADVQSAEEIARMIRGYSPWPGVSITLQNGESLKIIAAHTAPTISKNIGQITFGANELLLQTKEGVLAITTLKPAGKNEMPADAFMRGHLELNGVFVQ